MEIGVAGALVGVVFAFWGVGDGEFHQVLLHVTEKGLSIPLSFLVE